MTDKDKKGGLTRKLQDFLASYQGKVMLNYAYSWGAAIVILGALFKLTHLPGANFMLFAGMGTEVLVFFISAFDRPFKSYKWESVFPNIKIAGADYGKKEKEDETADESEDSMSTVMQAQGMQGQQTGGGGGAIFIGGMGGNIQVPQSVVQGAQPNVVTEATEAAGAVPTGTMPAGAGNMAGGVPFISIGSGGVAPVTPGVEVSPEMEEATKAYLDQLKEMTDALTRFVDQTKSMGPDAEQINRLNKNLNGINAIYEIQLRSISSQLGTLDEINEQSKKMASQIDELNKVYARMLEAMTVNMKVNGTDNV